MAYSKALKNDIVFDAINKYYVTLPEDEIRENNIYLHEVLASLIRRMKLTDQFFAQTYNRFVYTGSFYKNTKITKPDEYDMNIVIKLPVHQNDISIESSVPGYVKIKIENQQHLSKFSDLNSDYISWNMKRFLRGNLYVNQEYFRRWIESVISRAISKLPRCNSEFELRVDSGRIYKIKIIKSGPAFTLSFETDTGTLINVDLVPVLEFNKHLDKEGALLSKFKMRNWFAVPKPIIGDKLMQKNLYWRLSCSDQEKEMLSRHGQIKPVIRQMKKLRDTQNWPCLKSYFIETVFYHMVQDNNLYKSHEQGTLLFFEMLKRLQETIGEHRLDYFWNNSVNLLEDIHPEAIENIGFRLFRIIRNIEKCIEYDQFVIAQYILTTTELNSLKSILGCTVHYEPEDDLKFTEPILIQNTDSGKTGAQITNEDSWCSII